jgi:hypothetical protein
MPSTTQRLTEEHPYVGAGVVLIILSLGLIAFGLGVLAQCGHGSGVCFDPATHATSDGALVGFFVLLIIGVAMVLYQEGSVTTTRTDSPPAPTPQVNVITPAAAPIAPAPTTFVVNSPAPSPPPSTVTISTPR